MQATEVIQDDVMSTGYWFLLCQDIQKVWETCKPQTEVNEELQGEDQVVNSALMCPDEEDESDHST